MKSPRTSKFSGIVKFTIFSLGLGCLAVAIIGWVCVAPVNPAAKAISVKIASGSSLRSIASQLANRNLIRSSFVFQAMARFSGTGRRLQAGTYELSGAMSLTQIIDLLASGNTVANRFTVPEGLTVAQIAKLWEEANKGTAESFNRAVHQPQWQQRYGIEAETLEGYLFPDTYQFADGTPPSTVIEMMLDTFDRRWTHALDEEAESLRFSVHEIFTLASIIEKEAKADDERPLISSVFHNRLQKRWRLDADPTVLYALNNPKRLLTREDLKVDSPYNTYRNYGLPPAPICNPGMASILAALRPADAPYFFFVALGNGRHHFSKTLAEHQTMIRKIKQRVN